MQKAVTLINWENEPSTNTPLNEDNLNQMDNELDTIDDRVCSLYGYEEVAKQYRDEAEEFRDECEQATSSMTPIDQEMSSTSTHAVANATVYDAIQNIHIDVDSALSSTSENPVQNKVIKSALDNLSVGVELTQAEYDALPETKKTDGKEYFIKDSTATPFTVVECTQDEYNALTDAQKSAGQYLITDVNDTVNASQIEYDNSTSGMSADNVKDGLDELSTNLGEIDSAFMSLTTTTTTAAGAIFKDGPITFHKEFSSAPIIVGNVNSDSATANIEGLQVTFYNITTTGCRYRIRNIWSATFDANTVKLHWIARN